MLIDEIDFEVRAGHGGSGLVSFGKRIKSGPDGGDGGRGGDVYGRAVNNNTLLAYYKEHPIIEAEGGSPGGKHKKTGQAGRDTVLLFPTGTSLVDTETGKTVEFSYQGEEILLARGGLGGRGNDSFKSSKNTTPKKAQPGLPGEAKKYRAIMRLIADFGLVGLPNAGKSSLLNSLTAAKAKIADYPFTTLSPNLGVLDGKVIADIPGLIEGAALGRGLGLGFLKHIEKVELILHCVSAESADPMGDYRNVANELASYNPQLSQKPVLILLTKTDLLTSADVKKKAAVLAKSGKVVLPVSIFDDKSLIILRKKLLKVA